LTSEVACSGVRVVISVDWEGTSLDEANLTAMQKFRDDFAEIPLTHFLNPGYFTKLSETDATGVAKARDSIRSVLREGDEIGLHVHCDNHLLYSCGVTPKKYPSWNNLPDFTGHSVHLSSFSEDEVRRIVAFSCDTLTGHGFERPRAFRAGGWHADSTVLDALVAEGFTVDSSEVPHTSLDHFGDVKELWPDTSWVSQPYRARGLVEVPNNGCLADYVTAEEMVDNYLALVESAGDGTVVLSLGFHQETAAKFLPRLRSALLEMELLAATRRVPLEFERTIDVARTIDGSSEDEDEETEETAVVEAAHSRTAGAEAVTKQIHSRNTAESQHIHRTAAPAEPVPAVVYRTPEEAAKAAWLARQATGYSPVTWWAKQDPVGEEGSEENGQEQAAGQSSEVNGEEQAAGQGSEKSGEADLGLAGINIPPPAGFVWGAEPVY
jgi:hypothetical protein